MIRFIGLLMCAMCEITVGLPTSLGYSYGNDRNMQKEPNKKTLTILLLLIVAAIVVGWVISSRQDQETITTEKKPELTEKPKEPAWRLSPLGQAPDWTKLDTFQSVMTKERFVEDLTRYFTCSDAWQQYIKLADDHAMILMKSTSVEYYRVNFALPGKEEPVPRLWRKAEEWRQPKSAKPLAGLHVAVDPGHIGGEWAQMEERWFKIGDGIAVTEGDMTLHVARLIKKSLEEHGAVVTLVRNTTEPITPLRPAQLVEEARVDNPLLVSPFQLNKAAESLFYRTSEIRARAALVNEKIKPDICLCLHFNAVAWGDPAQPALVNENHFHILLNGAYTDEELGYDDQRFEMVKKILQGTIHEEAAVGATMASVFAVQTNLPPYPYEENSSRARNVENNPYLWARNLLANRSYDCPVIFFEPYVMNSHDVYARVQAGDYEGMPVVNGQPRKSIYREYADAVVDGLLEYYQAKP